MLPVIDPQPNPIKVECRHVVRVSDGEGGCGTGWALTGDLIVTCWHVIRVESGEVGKCIRVQVTDKHEWTEVTVIGISKSTDVAVLRMPSEVAYLYPLSITEGPVWMGQTIHSVGYPQCDGPIWSTGFTCEPSQDDIRIESSLFCEPGSSGSPVLDDTGTVIGMVQKGWTTNDRGIFLIPSALKEGISECLRP